MPDEKQPVRKHLFFSVLVGGGQVFEAHAASREALRSACAQHGVSLTISRNANTGVDRSRNIEVAKALAITDNPVTDFMFCDSDIVFNPKWVLDMVFTDGNDETKVGILAGAYPRKEIDWNRISKAAAAGVPAEDLHKYSTTFIINGWTGTGFQNTWATFAEVKEIGTGFMLIKREVLDKYIETYRDDIAYLTDYGNHGDVHHMVFKCDRDPMCELEKAKTALLTATYCPEDIGHILDAARHYQDMLKQQPTSLGRYITEDYNFCRHVEMMGYHIFLHMGAVVGHIGTHVYTGQLQEGLAVNEFECPPDLVFVIDEAKDYAIPGLTFKEPPVVLDIGANVGAFAVFAKQQWPGAKVTSYEPHPRLFPILERNVGKGNAFEMAITGAVGDKVELFKGRNDACGSLLPGGPDRNKDGEKFSVAAKPTWKLPPCDVLKVDTEGSEVDILAGYTHLHRCKAVMVEWHRHGDEKVLRHILGTAGFNIHSSNGDGEQFGILRAVKKEVT